MTERSQDAQDSGVSADLLVLGGCRNYLTQLPKPEAARVLKYLQDWNDKRPASNE